LRKSSKNRPEPASPPPSIRPLARLGEVALDRLLEPRQLAGLEQSSDHARSIAPEGGRQRGQVGRVCLSAHAAIIMSYRRDGNT
jgi:hypothetical protein